LPDKTSKGLGWQAFLKGFNSMDILGKSLQVLIQDWNGLPGLVGIYLLGSASVFLWLKTSFGSRLTSGELVSISLGGGVLPLFLGMLPVILLDFVLGIRLNFVYSWLGIFVLSALLAGRSALMSHRTAPAGVATPSSKTALLLNPATALVLIFSLSFLLRLAFIAGLTVPLYFDSAMHYSIIQGLITNFKTAALPDFSGFMGGYYHLGFHLLTAALSLALQIDINEGMLVLGQLLLALLPLPLFFILRQETKTDAAALFATLLAGWGWSMPAHAVNWGKYPALASLLTFGLFLGCIDLLRQAPRKHLWFWICFSGLSLLASAMLHTRSLILITLALVSAALALGWIRLPRWLRWTVAGALLAGLAAVVLIIEGKPALSLVFDPYRGVGLWLLVPFCLLLPLAWKEFPRAALAGTLFIALTLGSLLVSIVEFMPAYDAQTLLDRPLVQMVLALPLAFLGGLGYAGLMRTLKAARQPWAQGLLTALLFGAVLFNVSQAKFSPSDCCNFFSPDDLTAFQWMGQNLPASAKILVASSEGSVFEDSAKVVYTGSDAGIWVTALLRRTSLVLTSRVDFRRPAVRASLCQYGVTHIYVGSRGEESFNPAQLRAAPEWYQVQLDLPQAQVFRLIGCP
jgi:hypothetical protein